MWGQGGFLRVTFRETEEQGGSQSLRLSGKGPETLPPRVGSSFEHLPEVRGCPEDCPLLPPLSHQALIPSKARPPHEEALVPPPMGSILSHALST